MSWQELDFGSEATELINDEVPEEEVMYQFVAAFDNTCFECASLNGEMFPESALDETFPDWEEESEGVIHPHVHINCNCHLFAAEPEDVGLGIEDFTNESLEFGMWGTY